MKKKNIFGIVLLLAVCGISIYFIRMGSQESSVAKSTQTQPKKVLTNQEPALQIKKVAKKTVSTKSEPAAQRTIASTSAWKKELLSNLNRKLDTINAVATVKNMGSANLRVGNKDREVQHVLISVDKGKGNISSYEAFVNPTTGNVLRTWNQTRFENQAPVTMVLKSFRP